MSPEDIQRIFFVECEESLAAAEAGLAACQAGTQDDDTINGVFRAVHSIKGGAGAFGYAALQAYTHTFETLLSDVRDGSVPVSDALCTMLLRALDTLSDHVNAAKGEGDTPDDAALLAELTAAQAANAGGAAPPPPSAAAPTDSPPAAEPTFTAAAQADDDDDFGLDFDLDSLLDDIAGPGPTAAETDAADEASAPGWQLHLRAHAAAMRNGAEPLLQLRELAELGGKCLICDLSQLPLLDALDPAQGYFGWTFELPATVAEAEALDVFDFVRDDWSLATGAEAAIPPLRLDAPAAPPAPPAPASEPALAVRPDQQPDPAAAALAAASAPPPAALPAAAAGPGAAAPAAPSAAGQSIRIDLTKLDRLIDAVGELVIAQAMLAQRLADDNALNEQLLMLEGLTRDIQESAMAIRAQPIGSVFSRVPRILRELASSTGKHVQLEVFGETTELDKTVIERLGEPLTHLIRNAVDHGIESAEERLAAGKPAEGTLTLSAEQRSGRILIRIGDDGKGIDRARVLEKAIEKGIVAPDAQLSPEDVDSLIFAPGFSTAATVTSVSGRGVGMDVVRQNVKDLGGRITIESEAGKGTTFTLALPLTLAISDGMIVNVGDDALVVPLTHVVESLRPSPGEVQGIGAERQMLNIRGRFIPVVPVSRQPLTGVNLCEKVLIVVDTQIAGQAALLVDSISDQRQFVIKSLEANYRAVEGVAGATILGDGRVALILDVDGLVAAALGQSTLRESGMNVASAFVDGRLPGISPDVYSAGDFAAIASLIYAESGNVLHEGKAMLVYSRIAPLVRKSGKATFAEFITLVGKDPAERKRTVDALTTNHTFFFRENHHFQHLEQSVRPHLIQQVEAGGRVRIWSAGCSSGEETWSIAMTILGDDRAAGVRLARSDLKLLASDLAHHVLARATAATYTEDELKDVPPPLRRCWLKGSGNEVVLAEEARSMVRFRELNLLGEWPMREPFDVIFCRNVMIYFDQPTKERLVARFAAQLRPGGYLYIGHSERVAGPACDMLDVVGPTIYRRRAA